IKLNVGERDLTTAAIDQINGNIYFGTDLTFPGHVYMIHVGDGTQPMTEIGRLDMKVGTAASYPPDGTGSIPNNSPEVGGEIFFRSSILDVAQNAIYIGTDSRPGQIIKVGINGPTQLAFTQSAPLTTTGNPISPAVMVNVEDALGNVVPADSSTVTLALASGPPGATVAGSVTAVAVNGVATFNNLLLSAPGVYTFNATDGSLTPATSGQVIVTASISTSLAVSGGGTTAIPGASITYIFT